MPRLIVDASNVMGSRPDGWWRDRSGARRRLTLQLDDAADRLAAALLGAADAEVVVVHDGPPLETQALRALVRFAGHADDLIVALCGPGDVVATSDRELVARVRARGAEAIGAGRLLRLLEDAAAR